MEFATWRDVLMFVVTLIIGLIGVPITQAFKNYLKLQDKPAIILTAFIAGCFAFLEVWLSGQVVFSEITVKNFPWFFGLIFSVGTIYYHLLKDSKGIFGQRFMVRPPKNDG